MNEVRPSIPGWIIDFVSLAGDAIVTDSLRVAKWFGKQHKNVLRAIDRMEITDEYRRLHFAPTIQQIPGPKGAVRSERLITISKSGFQLLVMGFTGAKAIEMKIRYIEAFEWMARELLLRRMDEHDKREIQSKASGSIGGGLLYKRKLDIPALAAEKKQLDAELQLSFEFRP